MNYRRLLMIMGLTVLIDMAGFGIAIPVLPFRAQEFGADALAIGIMTAAYSIAQFIFTPIVGSVSDRYGRRPAILVTLALEAAGLIATAIAWSVPTLIAARFLGGIGGSSIGTAQAVVADISEPRDRARSMGVIGAAIGLGFVVGPAVGGLLSGIDHSAPFWAAAAVTLVDIVLVAVLLPETRRASAPRSATRARSLLRIADIRGLVLVTLLFTAAFAALETTLPLFTQHALGWGATQNGIAFAIVGVLMVIVQGGLMGRLVHRFGERPLLIAGLALISVGLVLVPIGGWLPAIVIGAGMAALGMALVYPTSTSLLSAVAPPDRVGVSLSLARSAGGLARGVAPALAGALYAIAGPSVQFMVAAGVCLLALLVALTLGQHVEPEQARAVSLSAQSGESPQS